MLKKFHGTVGVSLLVVAAFLAMSGHFPLSGQGENDVAPRLGKYKVISNNTLYVTDLELLPGNKYKVYHRVDNTLFGEGEYQYDPKAKFFKWLSGRYQTNGYGGTFAVADNGKKHIIKLTFSTWAYNESQEK